MVFRFSSICQGVLSAALFVTCSPFSVPMAGQEITGTIVGAVVDTIGATVVGAVVTMRNVRTNVTRHYSTNEAGLYVFPFLNPGSYQLTVETPGFQKYVQQNITLEVNQRLRLVSTLHWARLRKASPSQVHRPLLRPSMALSVRRLIRVPSLSFQSESESVEHRLSEP